MCFTACHWARIKAIVYGTSISDAAEAGFNELTVSNETLKAHGGTDVIIIPGFLRDECAELFQEWMANAANPAY